MEAFAERHEDAVTVFVRRLAPSTVRWSRFRPSAFFAVDPTTPHPARAYCRPTAFVNGSAADAW